jgi:phosphatidate cytidylyltransferase
VNKLLQRIVTAVILIVVLLVVFFALPPAAAVALVGAFVLAGSWEWAGFAGLSSSAGRAAYSGLALLMMIGVFAYYQTGRPVEWPIALGLGWWVVAFVLVLRYPVSVSPPATGLCGLLVLAPVWTAVLAILLSPSAGPAFVLLGLAMVWAADIGAYFVGRRFGRVKLAPGVSPGKTWEGVFGGLAAATVVAAIGARILELPLSVMFPIGLSVALISVLGDLTVSLFKRNVGLKDSGSLFPGHGGVLDRVDGVSAALPLFALQLSWTGLADL